MSVDFFRLRLSSTVAWALGASFFLARPVYAFGRCPPHYQLNSYQVLVYMALLGGALTALAVALFRVLTRRGYATLARVLVLPALLFGALVVVASGPALSLYADCELIEGADPNPFAEEVEGLPVTE